MLTSWPLNHKMSSASGCGAKPPKHLDPLTRGFASEQTGQTSPQTPCRLTFPANHALNLHSDLRYLLCLRPTAPLRFCINKFIVETPIDCQTSTRWQRSSWNILLNPFVVYNILCQCKYPVWQLPYVIYVCQYYDDSPVCSIKYQQNAALCIDCPTSAASMSASMWNPKSSPGRSVVLVVSYHYYSCLMHKWSVPQQTSYSKRTVSKWRVGDKGIIWDETMRQTSNYKAHNRNNRVINELLVLVLNHVTKDWRLSETLYVDIWSISTKLTAFCQFKYERQCAGCIVSVSILISWASVGFLSRGDFRLQQTVQTLLAFPFHIIGQRSWFFGRRPSRQQPTCRSVSVEVEAHNTHTGVAWRLRYQSTWHRFREPLWCADNLVDVEGGGARTDSR